MAAARQPPKTCERDGCTTVFQPMRADARFCSGQCRSRHRNAKRPAAASGSHVCPDCGRGFATPQGVGGHRGKAHPGAKARAAGRPALPVSRHTTPVPKPEAEAGSDIPANNIRPKVTATTEERPFQCKEPGCGHRSRSRGELEKHRDAWHDVKHPLPKVVAVEGAMEFPCPHDGCGRVYDDENRLNHHLRVIHEPRAAPGEPDLVMTEGEIVAGVAAGRMRGVKVG